MSDFRKLIVWQKSISLAKLIYLLTQKLPTEEKFGLISQMRRCAVSVPSNIAEGSKRRTKKDFTQFLKIASGSLAELETQLLLTEEIYNLKNEEINFLLKEVQRMTESLMKKL